MSDELREIELETARIKLERERMALAQELQRKQHIEDVKTAAANTVNAMTGDTSRRFFLTAGKIIAWLVVAYIIFSVLAITLGFA